MPRFHLEVTMRRPRKEQDVLNSLVSICLARQKNKKKTCCQPLHLHQLKRWQFIRTTINIFLKNLNIIIGIVGGFIGGNVLSWIGVDWGGGFWGSLGTAVVGAAILLWAWNLIKK